jgi:ferritin-like metal-binding protein YciE
LPKMAKAAASDELRQGFEEHLEQTRGHASRLEQIFESMESKPKRVKCKGMEGLVEEGAEVIDEHEEGDLRDAGLIAAAQKVEHYEIASYGTLRTYAQHLGEDEAVNLLQETLEEEKETDEKLTQLAEQINPEAAEGESESEEEEEGQLRKPAKKTSRGRRVA